MLICLAIVAEPTLPPASLDRTPVGLLQDCGVHAATGYCRLPHSSCVHDEGGWQCRCDNNFLMKSDGEECVQAPTKLFKDGTYEFTDDLTNTVGSITLPNVEGLDVNIIKNDVLTEGVFGSIAQENGTITIIRKNEVPIFDSILFNIFVTVRIDVRTISDIARVKITPKIINPVSVVALVVDGTRKGSFVTEIPGKSKYGSLNAELYALRGNYASYFQINHAGDIVCNKDIELDRMKDNETYAFITILNVEKDTQFAAIISVVILRNKFEVVMPENKEKSAIIGKFVDESEGQFQTKANLATDHLPTQYFSFRTKSGDLVVHTRPDYDACERLFEFVITIQMGIERSTIPTIITITDVNDSPPVFDQSDGYVFNVLFGMPVQSVLGVINATDVDTVGSVTYESDNSLFYVSQKGCVRNSKPLTEHTVPGYEITFTVTASDGIRSKTTSVSITLLKLDEKNPNLGQNYTATVYENSPVGSNLTSIMRSAVSNYTHFTIIGSDAMKYFKLNMNTGELRTKVVFDRENLPSGFAGDHIAFSVHGTLKDQDSCSISIIGEVNITIEDVNDNSPCFVTKNNDCQIHTQLQGRVKEESEKGTNVTFDNDIIVQDFDEVSKGDLIFHWEEDICQSSFDIMREEDGEVYVSLSNKAPPGAFDREKVTSYNCTLIVTDEDPVHTSSADILITLLDINDHDPHFSMATYNFTVMEDIPVNSVIGHVSATDKDTGKNAQLSYVIYSETFIIDSSTGIIKTKEHLDRETRSSYNITLSVSDEGHPRRTASATLNITVMDVNDNTPKFNQTNYVFTAFEDTANGSYIGTIKATDLDSGSNGQVDYHATSNIFIVQENGTLILNGKLDYESKTKWSVNVTASDHGSPPRSASTVVSMFVKDVNDNFPKFLSNNITFNISNPKHGHIVGIVSVTDKDSGLNGEVELSLNSTLSNHFSISNQGVITVDASVLPADSYHGQIRATDHGVPAKTSLCDLYINVVDNGGGFTGFSRNNFTFSIPEHLYHITAVGSLEVSVKNEKLNFSVVHDENGYGRLFFMASNGTLFCNTTLDREKKSSYSLLVSVHGRSTDKIGLALVNIDVEDVNDNKPVFYINDIQQFGISESANIGDPLKTFQGTYTTFAHDVDNGQNGSVHYNISDNPFFSINEDTGALIVKSKLDYEVWNTTQITVQAEDNGRPPLKSERTIEVLLSDTNDNPPTFVYADNEKWYTVNILENTTLNSHVFSFNSKIADKDVTPEYRYSNISIVNKERCPLTVGISGTEKYLVLRDTLDYEANNAFSCHIEAINIAVPHLNASTLLKVVVKDVNDNAPVISGPITTEVTNGQVFDAIATVNATDKDSNENGHISYHVLSSEYSGFFGINDNGVIQIVQSLMSLPVNKVTLYIQATDNGIPQLSSNITQVHVTLHFNNTLPWFPGQGGTCKKQSNSDIYRYKVVEHYGRLTVNPKFQEEAVVDMTACDLGIGRSVGVCNCTYTFVNTSSIKFFRINEDTGTIFQTGEIDRETIPYFVLTVKAEDHGKPRRFTYAVVNITVIDLDDNPPNFEKDDSGVHRLDVSNAEHPGYVIGNISANDPDYGINSTSMYSYKCVFCPEGKTFPFALNPTTGIITVNQTLELDQNNWFISVTAVGKRNHHLSASTFVSLWIIDENRYWPHFTKAEYVACARSDWTKGHIITSVVAQDEDQGRNGKVEYNITAGNIYDLFHLNTDNGLITLNKNLNDSIYPRSDMHLTIKVEDGGTQPKSNSTSVKIAIRNDCSPKSVDSTHVSIDKVLPSDKYKIPLIIVIVIAVVIILILVIAFLLQYNRQVAVQKKYRLSTLSVKIPQKKHLKDFTEMQAYSTLTTQTTSVSSDDYTTLKKRSELNKIEHEEYDMPNEEDMKL